MGATATMRLTLLTSLLLFPQSPQVKPGNVEQEIKTARLFYSQNYLRRTAAKTFINLLANEEDIDRLAEYKGLLQCMPFPVDKELAIESLERRKLPPALLPRTRALLATGPEGDPEYFARLARLHPYDFLLHSRFAFLSMMNGSHKKEVFDAVSAVERLTDNHPMALFLRAQRERITRLDDPDLWKKTSKALIYYKLVNYAGKLVSTKVGVEDSIESITRYLKKNGITPPEPTPEQYAAVKKRGWAFNKQMLEPFKKVE
jgi:hypothetical protein